MHLLYLHGYNSSPASTKASQIRQWLQQQHPHIEYICPLLSPFPHRAVEHILTVTAHVDWQNTLVMGSSMGGYLATWFSEKRACKAIVINPAVEPWTAEETLSGEQTNYHNGEVEHLSRQDIRDYVDYRIVSPSTPKNLWALLQTGDEVLDYTVAEHYYRHSTVTVEQGGDHGFVEFERYLPKILPFWNPQ